MYEIDNIKHPITVGRRGEKGIYSIILDINDWLEIWPDGVVNVSFKHEDDTGSFYLPLNQYTIGNGLLTIYVKQNMTLKTGRGYLGVELNVGEDIKKRSPIITLLIKEAMPDTDGTMPDPIQNWIDSASILVDEAIRVTNEAHAISDTIPQRIFDIFSNIKFTLENGMLIIEINLEDY